MAVERDYYGETVDRFEPNIAHVDASAFYASAAISLKRIADTLELIEKNQRETAMNLEFIRAAIAHR